MADSKEMQNQLNIQQQINKVLADRAGILDSQAKQITAQVQLAAELCKALDCKDLEGLSDRLGEINKGLTEAADNAGKLSEGTKEAGKAGEEAEKKTSGLAGAFGKAKEGVDGMKVAAAGAAAGMAKGFKSAVADVQMLGAAAMTAAGNLMNIGKSILSIPFKMFGGLVGMATAGGGGVNELKKAMEEVRGEFGSLATGEGKAVIDGFNDLKSSSGALAKTGIPLSKIYGRGKAGLANALKDVAELAKEAGNSFHMLSGSLMANAGQMAMMRKGLGMTNAALVEMTRQAQNAGQDVGEMLNATTSMAIQMGDKFGISAKTMGKNMSKLTENFAKLGKMSVKELGATAAYMSKLGIEAEDLLSVVDKFDTFESAADSASQLNQVFGLQIDAMEMMNAQNPAERIDMMRDAFHQTGKSVEDLTRQEKALMAEQMGLSVSAMENALAAENQGTNYEDLEAGAAEAEEQALTQEQAMSKLADSIEKMTEGGGGGLKGFFDAFAKGFMKGLKQSKAFREVLKAIRKALKIVFQFGKQVGKMFSDLMGEMGVWEGIKDLFDPTDLRNLLGINEKGGLTGTGLLGIFKKFKDALSGKGTYSPQQMAEDMGKEFKKFFSAKGPAFKKLGDAFAKGIQMLGAIISGLIPWVVGKLSDMIKGMADFIRNPKGLRKAGSTGIGGAIIGAIMDIGKAIVAAAPVLLSAILDLLSAVFEKHGGKIIAIGAALAGYVFIKMMIMGAISAAKAALFQVLVQKLVTMMGGATMQAGKAAEKSGKAGKKMGKSFKKGMKNMASGVKEFAREIASIKPGTLIKAALNMGLMALSFIPAMAAFALGLVVVAAILSLIKFSTLVKGIFALAIAVPTIAGMVYAALLLQPAMIGPAILGLLSGALLLTIGGIAFAIALGVLGVAVKTVGVNTILASIPALIAMGLGAAAMSYALVPMAVLGLLLTLVGLAMVGMVAAALMLAVGGVSFVLAIGLIGEVVKEVGLATIGAAIIGLIAIAIGAGAVALAAVALAAGAPFFGPAIPGAAMGALFLMTGGLLFMFAVGVFSEVIAGIPMGKVAKAMIALVLLTGATLAVAWIMTAGAATFVTGTIGALMATAFMYVVANALMPQITAAQAAGPKDPIGAALLMVKMAVLMGAAVLTAVIMTYGLSAFALGTVAAYISKFFFETLAKHTFPALVAMQESATFNIAKAIVVMLGLGILMGLATISAFIMAAGVQAYAIGIVGAFAAKFFFKAISHMYPDLAEAINQMDLGTLTKGAAMFGMLALIMLASVVMAFAGLVMIIFANPIVAWVAKKGFKAAGGMLKALVKHFGPAINELATLRVPDPAALEGIVRAIAGILTAMGDNVDIVLKLAVLQYFAGKDASVLKDAESFMNSMFEGMKGILTTLRRMVSSMKEEDIKKMESIGGVLAGIGKLMEALQPPPGLIKAMTKMAGGGLFKKAQPAKATAMLKQYGETMKMILNAVKDNIPPMIKQLIKIDVGDDPKMAKAKAELLGAVMTGVGSIAQAIGGIAASFMEQNQSEQGGLFSSKGPSMADTLSEMRPVFEYIMSLIKKNMKPIVTSVLEAVPDDIDPKQAGAKMEIVSAAMGAVANFASAIGTVADLMPPAGGGFLKKGKSMAERSGEMMMIVRKVVSAVKAHIGPLVKSVTGIKIDGDPKAMLAKMEVISGAMAAVSQFADVVGQIGGMGTPIEDISTMMTGIVQQIIASTTGGEFTLDALFPILESFAGTEASLEKLTIMENTFVKLGDFATSMGELAASGALTGGGYFVADSPFVEGVRMLVEQTRFALEALNSLGDLDANVALDNFASAIGTGGGEFTITNEPINITINMNVTMDANKVGRVLVDKSVMTSPLAAAE